MVSAGLDLKSGLQIFVIKDLKPSPTRSSRGYIESFLNRERFKKLPFENG